MAMSARQKWWVKAGIWTVIILTLGPVVINLVLSLVVWGWRYAITLPPPMAPTTASAPAGTVAPSAPAGAGAPATPPATAPVFGPVVEPPKDNSAEVLKAQLKNHDRQSLLDSLAWAEVRIAYPGVAEVVAGQLTGMDDQVSAEARRILIAGGSATVGQLVQSLETSEEARTKGLECLYQIGTPSVEPLLRRMGETSNFFTRESIKATLVALRDNAATAALTRAKLEEGKRNPDARISLAADQVLRAP